MNQDTIKPPPQKKGRRFFRQYWACSWYQERYGAERTKGLHYRVTVTDRKRNAQQKIHRPGAAASGSKRKKQLPLLAFGYDP